MSRALVGVLVAALAGPQAGRSQDSTPPAPAARARIWARPALSLLVPGAGQLAAHQDRAAVYFAVELYSLARALQLDHEGNSEGRRFRDLAFQVARRGFTSVRRDTVFEYYEMMERSSSPEYWAALQFYQQHAVGPDFRWSWRDAMAQQQVFRETISKSDNAFRSAQQYLGLVLANHVASAVDALISSRLSAAAGGRAALHTVIGPTTVVRVSLAF